jgi:hypothetical protein
MHLHLKLYADAVVVEHVSRDEKGDLVIIGSLPDKHAFIGTVTASPAPDRPSRWGTKYIRVTATGALKLI